MSVNNDILKTWIIKGDHDYGTALITFKHFPQYADTIAFHCQQAVEKYLKTVLLGKSVPFRKTHDLIYLLDLLSKAEEIDNIWYEKAFVLQDYAVEIRYPDASIELSEIDLSEALEIVKEFRQFTIDNLGLNFKFQDFDDK